MLSSVFGRVSSQTQRLSSLLLQCFAHHCHNKTRKMHTPDRHASVTILERFSRLCPTNKTQLTTRGQSYQALIVSKFKATTWNGYAKRENAHTVPSEWREVDGTKPGKHPSWTRGKTIVVAKSRTYESCQARRDTPHVRVVPSSGKCTQDMTKFCYRARLCHWFN